MPFAGVPIYSVMVKVLSCSIAIGCMAGVPFGISRFVGRGIKKEVLTTKEEERNKALQDIKGKGCTIIYGGKEEKEFGAIYSCSVKGIPSENEESYEDQMEALYYLEEENVFDQRNWDIESSTLFRRIVKLQYHKGSDSVESYLLLELEGEAEKKQLSLDSSSEDRWSLFGSFATYLEDSALTEIIQSGAN